MKTRIWIFHVLRFGSCPPMTDQCDKDFKKKKHVCFLLFVISTFVNLLLMCQFSGKTPLLKNHPFPSSFQFCDIVQECINKILWLTFLFPAINIFSCLSLLTYRFHSKFKLENDIDNQTCYLTAQWNLYLKCIL